MSMSQNHFEVPEDVETLSGEFDVGTEEENPNLQRVPERLFEELLSVEPPLQQSEPEPLVPQPRRRITTQQFERNLCATQENRSSSSDHPFLPVFSACSSELACVSRKQSRKVGVEESYLVTAKMFENPENDWLATASSRDRARVEVNIRQLSHGERSEFRSAQEKETDQWISNDVISICQRAGIRVRFTRGKWLRTMERRKRKPAFRERLHSTEIRLDSPTLSRLSRQLMFTECIFKRFSLEKGRREDSLSVW